MSHYAGVVTYDASKFVVKNRDELNEELVTLLLTSTVPLFTDLLSPPVEPEPEASDAKPVAARRRGGPMGGSKKRAPTMGQQFKKQVIKLMETLGATEPHFIRCLKPNEEKRSDLWDEARMTEQVVFNGIPENIKIAQGGFVWRVDYESFINRYKLCSARTWPMVKVEEGVVETEQETNSKACRFICEDSKLPEDKYVVGVKSKVFIKEHAVVELLEKRRDHELGRMVLSISKLGRGYAHRKAFMRLKKGANLAAKIYRTKFYAKKFKQQKQAAVLLQRRGRGLVARKAFRRLFEHEVAARVITTFAQGWKCRKQMPDEWKQRIAAASEVRAILTNCA